MTDILTESIARTLYHGTLKKYLPSILSIGLMSSVGEFTRRAYQENEDAGEELEELVFAANREGVGRCYSAILGALKTEGIPDTAENVYRYGAIVVIKEGEDRFEHREDDEDEYHPSTVEPGDYYYRGLAVKVDHVLTDNRLRNFFRRNGVFIDRLGTLDRSTMQAEVIRRLLQKSPQARDEIVRRVKDMPNMKLQDTLRRLTRHEFI